MGSRWRLREKRCWEFGLPHPSPSHCHTSRIGSWLWGSTGRRDGRDSELSSGVSNTQNPRSSGRTRRSSSGRKPPVTNISMFICFSGFYLPNSTGISASTGKIVNLGLENKTVSLSERRPIYGKNGTNLTPSSLVAIIIKAIFSFLSTRYSSENIADVSWRCGTQGCPGSIFEKSERRTARFHLICLSSSPGLCGGIVCTRPVRCWMWLFLTRKHRALKAEY